MDQKFFRVPWAASGDRASISESTNSDGTVSYPEGWGEDYQKDMLTDANAKPVERDVMNGVLNAITGAIRQYQTNGYPEWITAANNNSVAFGYDAGVVVSYNGALYLSMMAGNTATPGADAAKWQPYIQREATEAEALDGTGSTQVMTPRRTKALADSLDEKLFTSIKPYTVPVGGGMLWFTPIPPDGWLEANGQTFNTTENPKLTTVYPSGRLPDMRDRYPKAASDKSLIGTNGAGTSLEHYHLTSKFAGTSGSEGDDIYLPLRGDNWGSESYPGQGVFGNLNRVKSEQVPNQQSGNTTGTSNWRNADGTARAPVAEPDHTFCMIIIKTDQAEADAGEAGPTGIIITPATDSIEAGKARQFSAIVVPSNIGGNYPVSWAVSDTSLGSISSAGLYTANPGASGTQTIIASISTGLTSTAVITQSVWLTSITIGSIPSELLAGNTYNVPITYSPTGYTETVLTSSSDSSVAALSSTGVLDIYNAGTATLTLTGASSGVTRSVTVTATEVVAPEVYLAISKNFSEIKEAGTAAQTAARVNLGLGSLATKNSLGAGDVGAVPLASASLPAGTDLDSVTAAGEYFQSVTSNATTALHYPEAVAGALKVVATGVSAGACRQFYWPYSSGKEYRRAGFGTPIAFTEWSEH
ncbi:tail fiber protein [Klebsiella oxytoca]|uniref:tail fiber protein n=1 Tax=Klebsiella oxytoca TaxID=571 RepID=UPI0007CD092F|nr:tail fiber protein [Klebsiella oxytoca]MCW9590838.1 tail fiber protein [Klebsiella oxytoca]MCW9603637.1 tail fiber protein [Klebsiella oxytoca]MCW9624976.1 tail fiber protein [Klebsiella oxytoca]SAQ53280.1 Phage Tail Collar Domain [Klebsiella oxytoca]